MKCNGRRSSTKGEGSTRGPRLLYLAIVSERPFITPLPQRAQMLLFESNEKKFEKWWKKRRNGNQTLPAMKKLIIWTMWLFFFLISNQAQCSLWWKVPKARFIAPLRQCPVHCLSRFPMSSSLFSYTRLDWLMHSL